ncbi:glutathione S-transferase family protein [Pseudoduganella sp. FT25W]|uniref:Glutathione S-transferase family protein n=1 Tax=Duganella alba TaxID=2666081 RepID=A0A6L5QIU1_9BURK|nr:glutathione S-transferase N-terminal domain-containing protein [Duganella alba]MRX08901.1 glutathione S-transferase family protein [Duganella alba]MRX18805.1 glutathione S-transferase family protein [Duganella alba]
MYQLYAFATPNSIKAIIALEELWLDYQLHAVNVHQGEQKTEAFALLNPNAKVPVLISPGDTLVLTESAAILVYLAERHGLLLPREGVARARVFEQLFFHASGLGPAFGQSGYFQKSAPEVMPGAIARFHGEARRTLVLLDRLLATQAYVSGDSYSIADIAHFGWLWRREFANVDFSATPHVARWYEQIAARPAVQRAIARAERLKS